ncbi:protein-tyrosine-phosphatase [Rhodoligotrophos appendicifer]|uniref:arsenate reductase ArsC n=1 Tax=Rhodoligotrophos appendicifer TaxID=987056 RepID=UPI001184FB04|nr:arsenate reductase ArsC [Rhodoligotrophos appendicifer]
MNRELPQAVLFACGHNAVRSPIAAGLMRHFYGHRVHVVSCGVRAGDLDPFAIAVMAEWGIDISRHHPTSFEDLTDTMIDVIVSLTPEAHHQALEMTRSLPLDAEYWPTQDPTLTEGSREARLEAYRSVRDGLMAKIRSRFRREGAPVV